MTRRLVTSLDVSALPPFLQGPAVGLNAGLNAMLGTAAVQNTISLGSRWNVMKNMRQYDHINLGRDSAGSLINVQPDFQRGGSLNLLSICIDFVW